MPAEQGRLSEYRPLTDAQEDLIAVASVAALDEGLWRRPVTATEAEMQATIRALLVAIEEAFPDDE